MKIGLVWEQLQLPSFLVDPGLIFVPQGQICNLLPEFWSRSWLWFPVFGWLQMYKVNIFIFLLTCTFDHSSIIQRGHMLIDIVSFAT